MLDLVLEGNLHVLTLRDGENRLRPDSVLRWNEALDEVEREVGDGPGALVVIGEGKYWSNGIDLEWLSRAKPEEAKQYLPSLLALLGRILSLPMPTVAALNGHTFAAGAMLALAMDYRVMRTERGWFCLPEVDIHIPFHPGMLALIKLKLLPGTLRDAVLQGKRYTAEDALAAGLVDAISSDTQLLQRAKQCASQLAEKQRSTFARMKADLYGDVARQLQTGN